MIAINTSRISKAGEKISIIQIGSWCYELIKAIDDFKDTENYIDVFAKPCNYESEKMHLVPGAATVLFSKLIEDISTGKIESIRYKHGPVTPRRLDLRKLLQRSSVSFNLNEESPNDIYIAEPNINNPLLKKCKVVLQNKSIKIQSDRLRKIILHKKEASTESLVDYINRFSCFVVNFDDSELVYSNKNLFRDSALLGSIECLLKNP